MALPSPVRWSSLFRPTRRGLTSLNRAPSLPKVPAVSETIKDFDAAAWIILFAPTGTPAQILERMAEETGKALQDTEVKVKLADMGAAPVGGSPAQTAAYHRKEMAKFKRAVAISGASAE